MVFKESNVLFKPGLLNKTSTRTLKTLEKVVDKYYGVERASSKQEMILNLH